MSVLENNLFNSAFVFLALFCLLAGVWAAIQHYVDGRLAETQKRTIDLALDPKIGWRNLAYRMNVLSRLAPEWLAVSEERAAEFDDLFRSGGRPVGALTGREFLRACVMESVWIVMAVAFAFLIVSLFVPLSWFWVCAILLAVALLSGPNQVLAVRQAAKKHAVEVTREVPYFLDLVVLVMQAGGNFRTAIETFLRSVPSGAMRREVLLMRQQLAQGDAAVLLQLAERVRDPAVEQVIGTIAKGIETGGDPTRDAEQAERLRLIRSENAKALAKSLNTKMIFVVGVAFLGVILSIFAAVLPILGGFG